MAMQEVPMRLSVDPDRCQGHAMCVFTAEELVGLDEVTSRVVVVRAEVPVELHDLALAVVGGCPERALSVTP
jgi:ferredoxin